MICFDAAFQEMSCNLSVVLENVGGEFEAGFGALHMVEIVGPDIPVYRGGYTVRPEVEAQVLKTENKVMRADLTVQAIPYHEVDNQQDGQTVIIGGVELYGNQ